MDKDVHPSKTNNSKQASKQVSKRVSKQVYAQLDIDWGEGDTTTT
jgi:hypothetical protein